MAIDYLFNNVGIEGTSGPIELENEDVINEVLSVNVKGIALCIKYALPAMIEQGGNNASVVGIIVPVPMAVVYGASKAAVLSITQSVAISYAEQNIHIYGICPWITDTPMIDRLTGYQADAKAAFGASMNPSGKIATTDDIAGVVVSLFREQNMLKTGEAACG